MAEEGLRLTDFHSGATVCTPSRASLLTGRLGVRTGVIRNFFPDSVGGLPLNETTIAEVLKNSSYTTGMIGKWHLGITHNFHPRSRGFDYYYGLPYSNDMGCVDMEVANKPECRECPKTSNETEPPVCRFDENALPLYENYEIIEQPADLINLGDYYAEKAVDFIDSAVEADKPFFLYVAFAHMHVPIAHAERFTNSSSVKTMYADMLYEMDDVIGRIVASLKQNGVFNNTLTLFTGDNGPWVVKCPFNGSQGPFLGLWLTDTYGVGTTGKGSTWEAGHREPTVLTWPNVVAPNTTSGALTSALDVFPTIVAAAGGQMPSDRKFDGIDLYDLLSGKTETAHNELYHPNSFVSGEDGEIDTVRMGRYKIYWKTGGSAPDCDGNAAPLVVHDPPIVFDIENDPAESILLTKDNTPDLEQIISDAIALRANFYEDVKSDNTTVADYSTSPSVVPCCDPTQYYCRCKNDDSIQSTLP